MKRTITWIRHGESAWNALGKWQGHTDIALSELGCQQASSLTERLRDRHYDLIFSSDLGRALQTGQLAMPGATIKIDERLREINFGVYEGKSSSDLTDQERTDVYGWWAQPYARILQGGESMTCLNSRIQAWFEELPTACEVLVFTHGGVIRNALWQIVGIPTNGGWRVSVDNASISVFEYSDEVNVLRCFNDHAHLNLDLQGKPVKLAELPSNK